MPSRNQSRRSTHDSDLVSPIRRRSAIILIAGCLAYLNSVPNPFIFDDAWTVTTNESIRDLANLGAVFSPARELPTAGRPVVNLAFAINYAIGGVNVSGYHLWNICTHLFCALLIFGIVRRTLAMQTGYVKTAAHDLAFAVALLWTVHPLNTEAVDYVTQRTESMMAAFYLLTLYASIRALDTRRRAVWSTVAVAACALGMGSKESMVTAPLVVVLFDRVFVFASFREGFAARSKLYGGLAMTWLLLAVLVAGGPRRRSAGFDTGISPWTYLLNQAPILVRYFWLAVWPRALVQNYGWPGPIALATVLPYATVLIGLLTATAAAFRIRPRLAFLGAWIWLTLAPTSTIVPIATEVGAERRMYLPMVALLVLAVLGVAWLSRKAGRAAQATMLVLLSAVLAAGTVARNRDYSSSLTMARTNLDRYPTPVAHYELGMEILATGAHREEALAHLQQALPGAPRAHFSLGVEYLHDSRFDDSIAEFQAFIRDQPHLATVVDAHEYLGKIYAERNQWDAAIVEFQAMLAITPDNASAEYLLGNAYFNANAMNDAVVHFRKYLETKWNDVDALNDLGIALGSSGRIDEAIATFQRALEIDSQSGQAERNLGNALYLSHRTDEALVHAQRAVALEPDNEGARELLRTLEARHTGAALP